jgi:hypothetical protein
MKTSNERGLIRSQIYSKLPKELQLLTEDFKGREKDIVLLSTLGVLSNCLPNIWGYYDGDVVYPQLYIMIIAPAASGKGVMNYSRVLIEPIHDKIFNDSKNEYLLCNDGNKGKKKDKEICPEVMVKILPANISTSEMYAYMGSSKHGLLIMESEADTMSNMLNNDWSNYSDVLRKAFHHEPLSISRKMEKIFEDIKEPKLAIIISGTPDQLQPLIKSKENGLFSRFVIYNFDEINDFKDVFAEGNRDKKVPFKEFGNKVFDIYGILRSIENPIEFTFTEAQKKKFLKLIRPIRKDIIENHSEGFISNLHRHGIILFRIAMILSALRIFEDLPNKEKIVCTNTDFMLASFLMQKLLRHSQFTYDSIDNGGLSMQDQELLDCLNKTFTSKNAYDVGSRMQIPKRTMVSKLEQWQKKKIIKRVKKGNYIKL